MGRRCASLLSIRGAWAAGKVGKLLLGGYKDALDRNDSPRYATNAIYGLMAIAARHSRLRGEIRKALHGARPSGEDLVSQEIAALVEAGAATFDLVFDHSDVLRPFHHEVGGDLFIRQANRWRPQSPPRYATAADVPESLRLAALANAMGIDLNGVDTRMHVLLTLPWIAAAPPEDLYYPAEVISEVSIPFIPELVVKLLQEHAHYRGPRQPARAAKVPGRNDPCLCGSGQKYKRCCAQNTASPVYLELEAERIA